MEPILPLQGFEIRPLSVPGIGIRLDPSVLWGHLQRLTSRFLWLPEESERVLLTLSFATTYLKPKLEHAFHLVFSGETMSGKSQGLGLAHGICFEGIKLTGSTLSPFFRIQTANPEATLIMEEFSPQEAQGDDAAGIQSLMLSMIDRGNVTVRSEKVGDS